jgi:excisionase family DNA binding protein
MKDFMGLMDIQTVAKYLGVSERTIYRLLDKEGLPGAKVGRQWRFDRQAVEEWVRWKRK